jgi:hypothetical protein
MTATPRVFRPAPRKSRITLGALTVIIAALSPMSLGDPLARPRPGHVRLAGRSLVDDAGRFNARGATLFYAAWAYKHDRPRLERNLKILSQNGFDYIRALGVVGDPNAKDHWDGREIDWRDPDYAKTIAGVTDLAYDTYGLRVQWTLIADGQKNIPDPGDRRRLVDTFLAMSRGREHKIILFEIANEAWQNGFGGDAGERQLRGLTKYMNDRTDVLVAASAPRDAEQAKRIYAGDVADVATIHFDRDVSKADGHWRPVRQPWEHQFSGLPVGSSNEPIGPGSSVASENDPVKLVAAELVTHVSGLSMYVFHSKAGIRGDVDLAEMPGIDAFKHLKQIIPDDLASWTPKNAHWPDSPFRAYARDAAGNLLPDKMWPDLRGAAGGAVRVYAAVKDNEFFVVPLGVKGALILEPRRPATLEVIDPMTGQVSDQKSLQSGERFELKGHELFVLRGHFR